MLKRDAKDILNTNLLAEDGKFIFTYELPKKEEKKPKKKDEKKQK